MAALGTLSTFYDSNGPAERRGLRSAVEQRGLDISGRFLAAAETVISVSGGGVAVATLLLGLKCNQLSSQPLHSSHRRRTQQTHVCNFISLSTTCRRSWTRLLPAAHQQPPPSRAPRRRSPPPPHRPTPSTHAFAVA